jgi:hypothetical protein
LIYRNSSLAQQLSWNRDDTILAADIVLVFLRGERDLLRLAQLAKSTVADLETFLSRTEGVPLVVDRSAAGQLLIACQETGDSLFVTGKTAEVLRAYIDCQPVRGIDRDDMTLRRHASI